MALVLVLGLSSVAAAPAGFSGSPAETAGAPREPKVVIIVGPTGGLTDGFRAEAQAAARIARRYTSDVTTIYSPNATWAAVRPALQGASLVIYMGHGNGWPSSYRDSLYRPSQNGLGLNPVAGGDDHTHRYYGERYLARDVRLAKGAVVLLHHLCYAAGNSEPGLPEGPHEVAKQRVENYAAGWLSAGASAVVAEAYFAPAYYVRQVLGSNRSIEAIWRSSPTYKNNVDAWASRRTDNAAALIDPTRGGRYGRSLVYLEGKARAPGGEQMPASVDELPTDRQEPEPPPPLAGIHFGSPQVSGLPVVWSSVEVQLPVEVGEHAALPDELMLGAVWQPVELDRGPWPLGELLTPDFIAAHLATDDLPGEGTDDMPDAPEAQAVEVDGQREPLPAELRRGRLRVPLLTPELPGHYRLSFSLHDADGELLEPVGEPLETLDVYVAPPLSASYGVPETVQSSAGQLLSLPVTLHNNGAQSWEQREEELVEEFGPDPFRSLAPLPAQLVLYALSPPAGVDDPSLLPGDPLITLETRLQPSERAELSLSFEAPAAAGRYLLLLDIVTPSNGSLAEAGVAPALIVADVSPAPLPPAEPPLR